MRQFGYKLYNTCCSIVTSLFTISVHQYMLLFLICCLSVLLAFLSHAVTHWLVNQRFKMKIGTTPISVLKPMKGIDDELEKNLESFCNQLHPCYELLIGIADPQDPAVETSCRVAARYPNIVRVFIGECSGANPKIRLLKMLEAHASYETLLISDSNVRADECYLLTIAGELNDPSVGLVTNAIIGDGSATSGSRIENLMFNSYVVFGIGLSNFVAKYPCVIGKSMLLRREVLNKIGGFEAFENVLAEDYLIGHAVDGAGYKVVTSTFPITTINKTWTFRNVWSRHLRWAQIRKSLGWKTFLLEPLLLPHIWLAVLAIHFPIIAIFSYAALTVSEAVAVARWSCQKPTFTLLAFVSLRQFLQYTLWLIACAKRHVTWRGNRYRLYKGSSLLRTSSSI